MTDSSEALPPLSSEASRRLLLQHFKAGNILGFVILYDGMDAAVAEAARQEPVGLGRMILDVCRHINEGMPEHDMELGTDLGFLEPHEKATDYVGDDAILVPLSPEDADYLLEHMPTVFLDETTPEV